MRGDRTSIAHSARRQGEQRLAPRHGARPRGRAEEGDLRLVPAGVLPTLIQGGGPGRSRQPAAAGADVHVWTELAGYLQPRRACPGSVRDAWRTAGRGILPGGVSKQAPGYDLPASAKNLKSDT